MTHFMAKGVSFVTFPQPCRTPKPDIVKISFFAQINFTSTLDESIKVIIP